MNLADLAAHLPGDAAVHLVDHRPSSPPAAAPAPGAQSWRSSLPPTLPGPPRAVLRRAARGGERR